MKPEEIDNTAEMILLTMDPKPGLEIPEDQHWMRTILLYPKDRIVLIPMLLFFPKEKLETFLKLAMQVWGMLPEQVRPVICDYENITYMELKPLLGLLSNAGVLEDDHAEHFHDLNDRMMQYLDKRYPQHQTRPSMN